MAKTAGGRRNKEKKKASHKQQKQDSDLRKKGQHEEAKAIKIAKVTNEGIPGTGPKTL